MKESLKIPGDFETKIVFKRELMFEAASILGERVMLESAGLRININTLKGAKIPQIISYLPSALEVLEKQEFYEDLKKDTIQLVDNKPWDPIDLFTEELANISSRILSKSEKEESMLMEHIKATLVTLHKLRRVDYQKLGFKKNEFALFDDSSPWITPLNREGIKSVLSEIDNTTKQMLTTSEGAFWPNEVRAAHFFAAAYSTLANLGS